MCNCPNYSDCKQKFFKDELHEMKPMIYLIEHEFCAAHHEKCARFIVANTIGIKNIPNDLFPTQSNKALSILESKPHSNPSQATISQTKKSA